MGTEHLQPSAPDILLVREENIDGCGGFAIVLILLNTPVTPAQKEKLREEFIRLKATLDCPDTDTVVQLGVQRVLGDSSQWLGYEFIKY